MGNCANCGGSNENQNELEFKQSEKIEKKEKLEAGKANIFEAASDVNTSVRFTSLLKKNDEPTNLASNIEKYLSSSDFTLNEKLRFMLVVLREMTFPPEDIIENKSSAREFKEAFMVLIERHYQKIFDIFNEVKKGYKPLIKLIQIHELMQENFFSQELVSYGDELKKRMSILLQDSQSKYGDWRFLRKLLDQGENLNIETAKLKDQMVQGFIKKIEGAKKLLVWKTGKKSIKCVEEVINALVNLKNENPEGFFQCLKMGRFDKKLRTNNPNIKWSLILGDEGGLFLLLNSIMPGSIEEEIVLESGVSREFLEDKRDTHQKVILGKGAFGKVRFALSILGDMTVDFGQLVCVKKSNCLGKVVSKSHNTLENITDSTLEDYFAKKLNESIYAPKPLDMAILTNKSINEKHRKGYLIMEIVPENSADKVFSAPQYQRWEFQKPYIVDIMKTMKNLLLNERVFNSDLKPANTLFDPFSRKMAIIDLGSSLYIDKTKNVFDFDISIGGFGKTDKYCPPEILKIANDLNNDTDDNTNCRVNLMKAVSYLCGLTIAEVTSLLPEDRKSKDRIEEWLIGKNTDLDAASMSVFIGIVNQLIEKAPEKRLDIEKAIISVENIGSNEYIKKSMYEQYIFKSRILIDKDPSLLSLNLDIKEIRSKGVIEQSLVKGNPKRVKKQQIFNINSEINHFLEKEDKAIIFLLLGDAGSGKSLSLQLKFMEELEKWEYGKSALPIYFNMADEVDLERVILRLNSQVGCNLKLDSENDEIHLFVDSYDEGVGDAILKENKQYRTSESNLILKNEVVQVYMDKLKKWKRRKILISCRTDYVQGKDGDDLSNFQLKIGERLMDPIARYIVPIGYDGKDDSLSKNLNINKIVEKWLERESEVISSEPIIKAIKRMGLGDKMKTGLMFNMIMKILLNKIEISDAQKMRGFKIYESTIREEFNENWNKIVCNERESDKLNLLEEEVNIVFKEEEIKKNVNKAEAILKDSVWEGFLRIGERIAAEMIKRNKNRLIFDDIEKLIIKRKFEDEEQLRYEWKSLYYIFKLMGMKIERKNINLSDEINKEEMVIGFRHETYKNYFLLRGLKRILKSSETPDLDGYQDASLDEAYDERRIVSAVLDEGANIKNYEMLQFFGEELRYRDKKLKVLFRQILGNEQGKAKHLIQSSSTMKHNRRRSAVTITFLVASEYYFIKENLSDLDLSGADLRGGFFFGTKFERSILRFCDFRNANLTEAKLIEADLLHARLGVWPEFTHDKKIEFCCFRKDGMLMATSSNKTVKIWNINTGECLRTLDAHDDKILGLAFNFERNELISCDNKIIKTWNFESGECLKTIEEQSKYSDKVCFSPDGNRLATCFEEGLSQKIKIINMNTGDSVVTADIFDFKMNCICFSADGNVIATGHYLPRVNIFNSSNGISVNKLDNKDEPVLSVSLNPSGEIVAIGDDSKKVKIRECKSGQLLHILEGHKNRINSLNFSFDGKSLVSSDGKRILVWDVVVGGCIQTIEENIYGLENVCFSLDSKKLISCGDKLKMWDCSNGDCVRQLDGHVYEVNSVCFSLDGKTAATGSSDGKIKVWDCVTGECSQSFEGEELSIKSVSLTPDGYKVAGGGSLLKKGFSNYYKVSYLKIWDIRSGECTMTFEGCKMEVISVCFCPEGKRLASSGDVDENNLGEVYIWDAATGERLNILKGDNRAQVLSISYSKDGRILACGGLDGSVNLWDCSTGECVKTIRKGGSPAYTVCFSPDGINVAMSTVIEIIIWNSVTGEILNQLVWEDGEENPIIIVYGICFSSDGKNLISAGSNGGVKMFEILNGKCLLTIQAHAKKINCVSISSDGKMIATASDDKTVKLWEANANNDWALIVNLKGVEEPFSCERSSFERCKIDENNAKVLREKGAIM